MVPLEYFRAGHGGKVNEVQDEDMDGQQYGVVDGKHVRDMSDDHKDICKDWGREMDDNEETTPPNGRFLVFHYPVDMGQLFQD